MSYKEMRKSIEEMADNNYQDFVKTLISYEKGINKERNSRWLILPWFLMIGRYGRNTTLVQAMEKKQKEWKSLNREIL